MNKHAGTTSHGPARRRHAHRKVGRCRKMLALSLFLLFVLVIVYNVISILKSMDVIVSAKDAMYYPEHSFNYQIRTLAYKAYRNEWVGFASFPYVPCRKAVLKPEVSNYWFPNATVEKIEDIVFSRQSVSCAEFREVHGYNRYPPASQEELDFPLAFSLLFHTNFHQVHFLLRALYKPHNVYCLMPDAKSTPALMDAAKYTAKCLPNVFVASRLERITYAGFSRLMADINCMKDLVNYPVNWKYIINMPGQQFPLRTNLEMVRIIRNYNGGNDILGKTGRMTKPDRYRYKHIEIYNHNLGATLVLPTDEKNPRPPLGLRVVKGSAYNTMSREFIEYVLSEDDKIKQLLEWLKNVLSPDEYFWAMLNHNKIFDAPGRFRGPPSAKPHLTLFSRWNGESDCFLKIVRDVCILTPKDFPLLRKRYELFANKFYFNYYPSTLHCLDQMIFNRTISGQVDIEHMEFYKHLKFALPTDNEKLNDEYYQLYGI